MRVTAADAVLLLLCIYILFLLVLLLIFVASVALDSKNLLVNLTFGDLVHVMKNLHLKRYLKSSSQLSDSNITSFLGYSM